MGKKGEETKSFIRNEAYNLFAEKGFKEVTMKDICEATGLSRGGLYRHYNSPEQIFVEIMEGFLENQNNDFKSEIAKGTSAVLILEHVLNKYKIEMTDSKGSLSMAICEYFSSKDIAESENLLSQQYKASFESWNALIQYGIEKGEFCKTDARSIFDLILFSYQGVRMYSRLMQIEEGVPERIISQIKYLLLKK